MFCYSISADTFSVIKTMHNVLCIAICTCTVIVENYYVCYTHTHMCTFVITVLCVDIVLVASSGCNAI